MTFFSNRLDSFLESLNKDQPYNEIRASLMNCKFEKAVRKSKNGRMKALKSIKKVRT